MSEADEMNTKGVVLYRQGKYEESISYFERAIELEPDKSDYYTNKGKALKKLGRVESIACFTKAVDLAWPSSEKQK